MNQEDLNKMRAMAGLAPSFNKEERDRLNETAGKYQALREAKEVTDKESKKEAMDGGSHYCPKGGEKMPDEGKDVRHKKDDPDEKPVKEMAYDYDEIDDEERALADYDKKVDPDEYDDEEVEMGDDEESIKFHFGEGKKADKDYDGDGKIENSKKEYLDSKDKAIKKAKGEKVKEGAVDATVWGKDYGHDDVMIDRDESPDQAASMDVANTQKVLVPPKYKSLIKEQIGKLRKEADQVAVSDPHGSEFFYNTADAFEVILGHLKEGTRRSMNFAQIDLNRFMSPMIQRLPNEIYEFIVRGGKPPALSTLFKEIKVKNKTGADLSKADYTN